MVIQTKLVSTNLIFKDSTLNWYHRNILKLCYILYSFTKNITSFSTSITLVDKNFLYLTQFSILAHLLTFRETVLRILTSLPP